jgi:hypothetical protein
MARYKHNQVKLDKSLLAGIIYAECIDNSATATNIICEY